MCNLCYQSICDCRCPNYIPPKTYHTCHLCKDEIEIGEEYVESYDGKYAHLECCELFLISEVLEFLDIEVRKMEDKN